jgi:hypothetical protein
MGTDGRVVAYPPGWKYRMGTDGRIVPHFPESALPASGSDERIVTYLHNLPCNNHECDFVTFVFVNVDQRMLLYALADEQEFDAYIQYLVILNDD